MSLIRSLFMYATPIWLPNTSPSLIQKLQTIQNSAVRIATGCVRMTPINSLHEETKMFPVEDHLPPIYLSISRQSSSVSNLTTLPIV